MVRSAPNHNLDGSLYFSAGSFASPCHSLFVDTKLVYTLLNHMGNLKIILLQVFHSIGVTFVDHCDGKLQVRVVGLENR